MKHLLMLEMVSQATVKLAFVMNIVEMGIRVVQPLLLVLIRSLLSNDLPVMAFSGVLRRLLQIDQVGTFVSWQHCVDLFLVEMHWLDVVLVVILMVELSMRLVVLVILDHKSALNRLQVTTFSVFVALLRFLGCLSLLAVSLGLHVLARLEFAKFSLWLLISGM